MLAERNATWNHQIVWCEPTIGANTSAASVAPIGPVPRGSASAATSLRSQRYAYPTASAPNGLPGNAKIEPQCRLYRRIAVTSAAPAAYHGPSSTAATTFTVCCSGAIFAGPTGML